MHSTLMNNEVRANRETDSALIQKILTNGDIQKGIRDLHDKVVEGDQDDICRQFDYLKNYIYNTYQDELKARGSKINPAQSASDIIEAVYGNIVSAQTGEVSDLRSDIKRYGDSSTMNGFMSGFREGNHTRYVDQTLSHCFGLEIDQKETKDNRKTVASYVGRGASVIEKGVYGAAGGAALYGLWRAGKAGFKAVFGTGSSAAATAAGGATGGATKSFFKNMGKWAWIGAAVGAAADIWWQCSSSRDAA